jgi:hypothetical protein
MNHPIDIKSALIGLCLGVTAMLALGASSPTSGPVGRYQIAGTANHGLVIDTATGKVWRAHLPASPSISNGDFFDPKAGEKK